MRFGEALAKHRKEANLSQEQLAEKLHVSRQAVSKWESEQSVPDIYTIQKVVELFGLSIDDFLSDPQQITVNEPKGNGSFKIISMVFMLVVFMSGIVLYIFGTFFYKDTFEPLPVWLSFFLCGISLAYFVVTEVIRIIRKKH